jgi:hypothetical protein
MVWERNGDAYHAKVVGPDDEPLFHVIVERLPEGMWDWTVWLPPGAPELAMRGVARTVQAAMRAAEDSADALLI